ADAWVRAHGLFTLAVLMVYSTNAMFHDLTLMPSEQWLLFLVGGAAVGLHGSIRVDAFSTQPQAQPAATAETTFPGLGSSRLQSPA
ncbi:MAG: hypothetical protein MI725_05465, partial [Pirellulales bacterium]|nr:hypothetical protein [Pirellulales bacterium]